MAAETPKVSLKLLVDTKNQKVIFAEAGKDFIDFLFNILSLPLATVVRIVTKQQMVGSLSNLYESVENFNQTYIQTNQEKDTLLKPNSQNPNLFNQVPLLPLDSTTITITAEAAPANKNFYKCSNSLYNQCSMYVTDDPRACCPICSGQLGRSLTFVDSPGAAAGKSKAAAVSGGGGGFVKGIATYMVMDDLVVMPLSIISGISQLSKFHVKEVDVLEERIVEVGMDEGVKLLKESLQSKSVLTNVFLKKKTTIVEVAADVEVLPSYF